MNKDVLKRNIVDGKTAWWLKEHGYKGWCSGYYHENEYEECKGEDALEYFDYECIGSRSGFVNENSVYRAAAPTLIEAYQFVIDNGIIDADMYRDEKGIIVINVIHDGLHSFEASTTDNAISLLFESILHTKI